MAVVLFAASVVSLLLFSGETLEAQQGRQKIVVAGAQSVIHLAKEFSEQFQRKYSRIEVEHRGAGSNYAAEKTLEGEVDIGLIARDLTRTERFQLEAVQFGQDAILLATYPGNPVNTLTLEQIRRIYLGEITNWAAVGGEEAAIVPLNREKGSNVRSLFIRHLFHNEFRGKEKGHVIRATKHHILKTLKRIKGSLGYGIFQPEHAEGEGVNVLSVNGHKPDERNVRNGRYPFTRAHLLISQRNPDDIVVKWKLEFLEFIKSASATVQN